MGDKRDKKRPGREAERPRATSGCVQLAVGRFWVSVDLKTGIATSDHGYLIAVEDRDAITRAVLSMLRKHDVEPEDPLKLRDVMFG